MINIENTENNQDKSEPIQTDPVKPDEKGGFAFSGFFKISDPESGEIIMQGRA